MTHPSEESPQPCRWHHCAIVEVPIMDATTGYQMGTTWVCPQCEDEDAADEESRRRIEQEDREARERADALRTRASRAERVWRELEAIPMRDWADLGFLSREGLVRAQFRLLDRLDRARIRYHAAVDELVGLCLERASA